MRRRRRIGPGLGRRRPFWVLLALAGLTALFYGQGRPAVREGGAEALPAAMTARVTAVPDGDSLVVADRDGREYRVRLYGLDAPEGGQPHGAEAARFLAAAVAGREVVLKTLDRDVYGRLVALVCLEDGEPVNRRLVSAGLAWVYTAYCHIPECAQWRKDEARARRDRRGLWQAPHPTPPWKYRRQGQG